MEPNECLKRFYEENCQDLPSFESIDVLYRLLSAINHLKEFKENEESAVAVKNEDTASDSCKNYTTRSGGKKI